MLAETFFGQSSHGFGRSGLEGYLLGNGLDKARVWTGCDVGKDTPLPSSIQRNQT